MLREKWRDELRNRFGVDAQIVDADGLLDSFKIPTHTLGEGRAWIISYNAARPPKPWEPGGRAESDRPGARWELVEFLYKNSEEMPLIDLVVFDEAHYMRNSDTTTWKVGNLLRELSSYQLMRAKAALGLNERRTVDISEGDRVVADPQFNSIAQEIANRSITLVRDDKKSVPLGDRPLLNITFTDDDNRAIARPFVEELRRGGTEVEAITLDRRSDTVDVERVLARLTESSGPVIYGVFVRGPLPPLALRLTEEISKTAAPAVGAVFGSPYLLAAMPNGPSYIAAYGPHPVSQRAAAQALLGNIDIAGKLPVTLPGPWPGRKAKVSPITTETQGRRSVLVPRHIDRRPRKVQARGRVKTRSIDRPFEPPL